VADNWKVFLENFLHHNNIVLAVITQQVCVIVFDVMYRQLGCTLMVSKISAFEKISFQSHLLPARYFFCSKSLAKLHNNNLLLLVYLLALMC